MITAFDLNLIIPMSFIGIFIIGFTRFMVYQEKKIKDLEDKAPPD